MKNLLYLIMCVSLCLTGLASCQDEDYDCFSPTNGSNLPENLVQGTYNGTFTRCTSSDTASASGTLVLTPSDTAYCVNVAFVSEEFKLDKQVRMNIMPRGNGGYAFEVNTIANAIGQPIIGSIDAEGHISVAFSYKQVSGRKTTTYQYSFSGNK